MLPAVRRTSQKVLICHGGPRHFLHVLVSHPSNLSDTFTQRCFCECCFFSLASPFSTYEILSILPGSAQIIPLWQRMWADPQYPLSSDSGGLKTPEVELSTWLKKETFPGLCWSWETGSFSPFLLQECEGGVRTWSLGRGTRWRHLGPWHGAVAPSALDYAVQAIIWEQTKVRSLFLKLLSFWFSLGSPILYPKNSPSSVKSSERASA